jgi:hypothetical protein
MNKDKWRLFGKKPSPVTQDESSMMTLAELDEVERTTEVLVEDIKIVKNESLVLAQSSLATLMTAEQAANSCLTSLDLQSGTC